MDFTDKISPPLVGGEIYENNRKDKQMETIISFVKNSALKNFLLSVL